MKSITAKKVVAIFSIVFGAISIFGSLDTETTVPSIILAVAIIVIGILLLLPALKKAEKGLMITGLVLYSLFIFMGVLLLFVVPILGVMFMMMFGVPFAFSIVYLVQLNKEQISAREKATTAHNAKGSFDQQIAEAAAKLLALQQEMAAASSGASTQKEDENSAGRD